MGTTKVWMIAIVSFVLSSWLFEASSYAMIIIFALLELLDTSFGDDVDAWKKTNKYKIILTMCICGVFLIVFGLKVIKSDVCIIMGAILFSSSFSGILVKDAYEYIFDKH